MSAAPPLTPREALAELGFELGPVRPFKRSHHPAPAGKSSFAAVLSQDLWSVPEAGGDPRPYRIAVFEAPDGTEEAGLDARLLVLLAGHAKYHAERAAWLRGLPPEHRAERDAADEVAHEEARARVVALLSRVGRSP